MSEAVTATRSSELRTRATAGAAMIVVALIALWLGGLALWLLASAAALLVLAEWAGLMRSRRARAALALACLAPVLVVIAPPVWGADRNAVALLVTAGLAIAVLTGSTRLGFGLVYAGAPAIALLYLRGEPAGFGIALWTVAVVVATDVGAYFAGRAIRGAKLAPRISPAKTWSGLGGGVIAALLVGLVVALAAGLPAGFRWAGAPLAILAQAGDLYESALKRRAGVKDSGRILPGHGGVMDRLDGLIPVVSVVALALAAASGA